MSPPGRARNLSPAPTTGPVVSGIRWLGAPRGFQGANSEQFWKWNHENPKRRRYLMELEYFSQCKVAVSLLFEYMFSCNPSGYTEHEVGWRLQCRLPTSEAKMVPLQTHSIPDFFPSPQNLFVQLESGWGSA